MRRGRRPQSLSELLRGRPGAPKTCARSSRVSSLVCSQVPGGGTGGRCRPAVDYRSPEASAVAECAGESPGRARGQATWPSGGTPLGQEPIHGHHSTVTATSSPCQGAPDPKNRPGLAWRAFPRLLKGHCMGSRNSMQLPACECARVSREPLLAWQPVEKKALRAPSGAVGPSLLRLTYVETPYRLRFRRRDPTREASRSPSMLFFNGLQEINKGTARSVFPLPLCPWDTVLVPRTQKFGKMFFTFSVVAYKY